MTGIVEAALADLVEIERQRKELRERQEREALDARERFREELATRAIKMLQKMNQEVFSGLTTDHWIWHSRSSDSIYHQVPGAGRIYLWKKIDGHADWRWALGYFKDKMGYGGDEFSSWSGLAELIGRHKAAPK